MMKRLIISTAVLFNTLLAFAQPGFMGKNFSVGYSFEVLPYLNWLNGKEIGVGGDYKDAPFELITGHHLNIGAAVTRRLELIAYAGIRNRDVNYFPYNGFSIDGTSVYLHAPKGVKMRETFYDFGFRRYFKKYVAPVGYYHQFIFGQVGLDFQDDSAPLRLKSYENSAQEIDTSLDTGNAKQIKFFRLSYGLGIKTMLSKLIFINAEGNIHFNIKSTDSSGSYELSNSKYLNSILESNFNFHRRYDFKLGLGLMF